jgi:hypothetical protein
VGIAEKSGLGAAGVEGVAESTGAVEGALRMMGAAGRAAVACGLSRGEGITLRSGAGAVGFDGAASAVDGWEGASPISGALGAVARFADGRAGTDE